MFKVICWFLIFGGLYYAYQSGWFDGITDYFSDAAKQAREEKVIYHEDGSYSTVEYRNIFDLLLGK